MTDDKAQFRLRIKEYKLIARENISPDPRNWRRHPETQRDSVNTILERLGWADVCIVRPHPDSDEDYILVDGELRWTLATPGSVLPCIVTDLSHDEAGDILAVLDPLSALAVTDVDALTELLEGITDEVVKDVAEAVNDIDWDIDADLDDEDPKPPEDLRVLIRVRCKPSDKEALTQVIEDAISNYEGAEVTG